MSIRTFSTREIIDLYNTKVSKSVNYFKKYENLDSFKDGIIDEMLVGRDYPRVPCILDFKEWVLKYNIKPKNLAVTCKKDFELKYLKYKNITELSYEGDLDYNNNENDLHFLNLKDKTHDFFLFSQTLEHLYNPLLAVKNIFNNLPSKAYVFTSVPCINIPHRVPWHYYGIYPIGLVTLFMSVGFNILETGQWGNHNYIKFLFKNHTWPDYEQLKIAGNGIVTNEDRNVAQCWCLAQKP